MKILPYSTNSDIIIIVTLHSPDFYTTTPAKCLIWHVVKKLCDKNTRHLIIPFSRYSGNKGVMMYINTLNIKLSTYSKVKMIKITLFG